MTTAQWLRDRSQKFAIDVIQFCDGLPSDHRTQVIAGQLHDAAHVATPSLLPKCASPLKKLTKPKAAQDFRGVKADDYAANCREPDDAKATSQITQSINHSIGDPSIPKSPIQIAKSPNQSIAKCVSH